MQQNTFRIQTNEHKKNAGQHWRLLTGDSIATARVQYARRITIESPSRTVGPEEIPGAENIWHLITNGNLIEEDSDIFTIEGTTPKQSQRGNTKTGPPIWTISFNKQYLLSPKFNGKWICKTRKELLVANQIFFEVACWTYHQGSESFFRARGVPYFDGTTLHLRES